MIPIINRFDYVFKNRPITYENWNNDDFKVTLPCIVLCHKTTNIAVAYPGYERWYIPFNTAGAKCTETYRKRAHAIQYFLNYILSNSTAATLQDVTLKDIKGFLAYYRTTEKYGDRAIEEWKRDIECVYKFLSTYHKHNQCRFPFAYDPKDLYRPCGTIYIRSKRRKHEIKWKCNYFSIKAPRKTLKKLRYLPEQFLDIILAVAKVYDPMLVLPIAVQAYAGLRRGEVVNLSRDAVKIIYGGFGTIRKIVLDISKPAPFAQSYKGKCDFGSIKVPRIQEVFPDFTSQVKDMILEHYKFLESLGAPDDKDSPLFLNRHGKAMTVDTYAVRVKNLFYNHFLPALRRLQDLDTGNTIYKEYYDLYKKNYPGVHMFRHWFTMYLLLHMKRSPGIAVEDLVAKWRGDSSRDSMQDYVHIYAMPISLYETSVINFQKSWIVEVL